VSEHEAAEAPVLAPTAELVAAPALVAAAELPADPALLADPALVAAAALVAADDAELLLLLDEHPARASEAAIVAAITGR
jgi:hypothetical protein